MSRFCVLILMILVLIAIHYEVSACTFPKNVKNSCKRGSLTCQNEGRCVWDGGKQKCSCRRISQYGVIIYFYGRLCEFRNIVRITGTCKISNGGTATCYCHDGRHERCNYLDTPANICK